MAHRFTEEEFSRQLADAAEKVEIGGRYVHYKNPDRAYIVKSLAVLEATEEIAVVYEAQYGKRLSFVRPLSSWLEEVGQGSARTARFRKA